MKALLLALALLQCVDFGNTSRYAAANAALPSLAMGQQRFVVIGDSITDLWVSVAPSSLTTNPDYVWRGISGQTTGQVLLRFRADVVNVRATAVVILIGINDVGGMQGYTTDAQIEDGIATLAEIATASHIRVVLATLLPTCCSRVTTHPISRVLTINTWIRAHVLARGYVLCDYYAALLDPVTGLVDDSLIPDGVHPTAAGYARMAPVLDAAIQRTMGEGHDR